jgi:hypothetical protein
MLGHVFGKGIRFELLSQESELEGFQLVIRSLSKGDVDKEPFLVWNAFVDLMVNEEYEDLNEIQRVAYLCFWYDSEVQNGGHLQYFENRGLSMLPDSIAALNSLEAISQGRILKKAVEKFSAEPRKKIETVEEYVERALEGEFDELDELYYKSTPSVLDLLEKYLERNKEQFITIK